MDAAATFSRGSDARVMSLVGFAHATSHFFHLVIPSLFPWLMAEFGLNFTRAGTLTAAFFLVSGVGQALAGFVVDRYGAQNTLFAGVGLLALSGLVLASAHGYPSLLAAAVIAGAGNAVFHPADYTVLNHSVSPARLGPAFSAHGVSGNLGWAVAPLVVTGLAAVAGWRVAALGASGLATAALASLVLFRTSFAIPASARQTASALRTEPFAFLRAPAIWMCFLYFLFSMLGFGALQNFAPSLLRSVYGLQLSAAASAFSLFLLGGAAGIAAGGFLAARYQAHERVVAVLLVAAATLALALATSAVPGIALAPLMALFGFCTGGAGPSRDLLVRKAAMERFGQRSFGRIYGFVYSGIDAGMSIAPVLFGRMMDRGMFSAVLYGVALFQVLAVLVALRVGQARVASAALAR
jgi:FSR family fosmidomycin resistance protein-like MFS transporter